MRKTAKNNNPPPRAVAGPIETRPPTWTLAALLALATTALYWPALRCGFVNYDDPQYLTDNARVMAGLSADSIRWAFASRDFFNWHPVTWLSHMLDCQLFGLNAWGHHLTSVLLHSLNGALVFALLRTMTGATWRSLLAAALFAVHPLRVESVAWVAERKDVLSAFFGLLALDCYVRWARERQGRGRASIFYPLSVLFLALGLMSKQMLVTWPFIMLLLDYWPLNRLQTASVFHRLKEKIPFFVLASAASVAAFAAQRQGGALAAAAGSTLAARGVNALISYCRYLGKVFWPQDLALFYPPQQWPISTALWAGALLCGVTSIFFAARKRFPFLLMGWLWYLGALVPVIGLVQVGLQSMADRYSYIPTIGILIAAVWGLRELFGRSRPRLVALAGAGLAAVLSCAAVTREQLSHWKNSETLFSRALAVTKGNWVAHHNLGMDLNERGMTDEAIAHFRQALLLKPDCVEAHNGLGGALEKMGRTVEAALIYREAIRIKPDDAAARNNLGAVYHMQGQMADAIRQYFEAVRLSPENATTRYNLATALGQSGRTDEAIGQFREALRLRPDYAEAHHNLGNALAQKGFPGEARAHYEEAQRLRPEHPRSRDGATRALRPK